MATLLDRAFGAARLDVATYEEVEHDPSALGQAMTVVVVAALAAGIGAGTQHGLGPLALAASVVGNLAAWFVWAGVVYLVGTRLLPTPDTKADLGQLLRTTGFSAAPGVFAVAGFVPVVGVPVVVAAGLWQLATMVVAVRQALDYTSTGRAIAVCAIGFVAYVLVGVVVVAACVGSLAAGGSGAGAIG